MASSEPPYEVWNDAKQLEDWVVWHYGQYLFDRMPDVDAWIARVASLTNRTFNQVQLEMRIFDQEIRAGHYD